MKSSISKTKNVDNDRFGFGKNWQLFLKTVDEERIGQAKISLQKSLGIENLAGKTFIDIGCGSGLFSYAAYLLGAERIVSFDYDTFSVECCKWFHKRASNPTNWVVLQGSVLDKPFLDTLGKFDIVYSWGVLHHTGKMWEAISNASKMVSEHGVLFISIYNKAERLLGTNYWIRVKRLYNKSPKVIKWLLETMQMTESVIYYLIHLKNPIKEIKNYKSLRGMNWRRDITDWVGGYPYEAATVEEIFVFFKKEFPSFQLQNIKTTNDLSTNEFVFKRE